MCGIDRRSFVSGLGTATVAGLAGCAGDEDGGGGEETTEPSNDGDGSGGGETYEVGHGEYKTTVNAENFPETLYIYAVQTGWSNWDAVMEAFQDRYGVELFDDQRTSGEALTHIRSNAGNQEYSAYNGGYSFGITAMDEGFTTDYKPANWDKVPDDLKTDNGHITATRRMTTAVTYRKDVYEERGLGEPETWDDFKHPDAAQDFAITPPHGTNGLATALSINNAYGGSLENVDPVVDYYNKIAEMGADTRRNVGGDFTSGEISAVAQYDYTGLDLKYNIDEIDEEKVGIALVTGPDGEKGGINVPYGYGMLEGRQDEEACKLFMDFVLSLDGQQLFLDAFVRPIRADELDMPEEFPAQSKYDATEFTVDQTELVAKQEEIISEITERADIPGIQG